MSQDFATNIVFLLTVIGAAGGLWWRIEAAIAKAKNEATTQASAASAQAHLALAQLAEHKLHTAETYVTKAGMSEQTAAIMRAIDTVGEKIDRTNERLDRVFEQPTRPRRGS